MAIEQLLNFRKRRIFISPKEKNGNAYLKFKNSFNVLLSALSSRSKIQMKL
jgi:hypothetical protein